MVTGDQPGDSGVIWAPTEITGDFGPTLYLKNPLWRLQFVSLTKPPIQEKELEDLQLTFTNSTWW